MGAKASTPKLSKDQKKLNSFYTYEIPTSKLAEIETKVRKARYMYLFRGLAFGFIFQCLLNQTDVYTNINRKATTRRLSNPPNMQTPRGKRRPPWSPRSTQLINQNDSHFI